jgi:hypothetical protein
VGFHEYGAAEAAAGEVPDEAAGTAAAAAFSDKGWAALVTAVSAGEGAVFAATVSAAKPAADKAVAAPALGVSAMM